MAEYLEPSRIHEHDIADVFAAFDVDRDDVISEQDMASFIHNHSMATSSDITSREARPKVLGKGA